MSSASSRRASLPNMPQLEILFITRTLTSVSHPSPPPPQADCDQADQTRIPGGKKFGLLDKVQQSAFPKRQNGTRPTNQTNPKGNHTTPPFHCLYNSKIQTPTLWGHLIANVLASCPSGGGAMHAFLLYLDESWRGILHSSVAGDWPIVVLSPHQSLGPLERTGPLASCKA